MRRHLKKIIVVVVVLIAVLCYFASRTEFYRMWYAVSKLKSSTGLEAKNIGLQIYNITKGEHVYSLNEDKKFSIASINKIFIESTILYHLKPDFAFSTTVAGASPNNEGVVEGPLYIVGSGDPMFSSKNMASLVNNMVSAGIKKIKGDIVLDVSLFEPVNESEGTMYSVSLSPLLVDMNLLVLDRCNVEGDPLYTDSYGCATPIEKDTKMEEVLYPRRITLHVESPVNYFIRILKHKLADKKIELSGKFRVGVYEQKEPVLFKMETNSLKAVLNYMLKESSNLFAEQMLQVTAASIKVSGEKQSPLKLVEDFLTKVIGVDRADFVLNDASGMSHQTKATPFAIIKVLNSMYGNKSYSFLKDLPVYGVDGSLGAFKNAKLKGKIRAKTGTLVNTGVRGMAGYIDAGSNIYSFVIVVDASSAMNFSAYESNFLEEIFSILEEQ